MKSVPAGLGLCALLVAACAANPDLPPSPGLTTPAPSASPAAATPAPAPDPTVWDVDRSGVPRFITHNYIALTLITDVSRFRSGEGHSYTDTFETCRSMKHYFRPPGDSRAESIPIYAPVTGDVISAESEWAGVQIAIRPAAYPAFRVVIFHVNPIVSLAAGTRLEGGDAIGTHVGSQTMSDVAVGVDTPGGYQLVSWFDAITDEVFDAYRARGLQSRDDAVITRAARDASPLACSGEAFLDTGALPHWVSLR